MRVRRQRRAREHVGHLVFATDVRPGGLPGRQRVYNKSAPRARSMRGSRDRSPPHRFVDARQARWQLTALNGPVFRHGRERASRGGGVGHHSDRGAHAETTAIGRYGAAAAALAILLGCAPPLPPIRSSVPGSRPACPKASAARRAVYVAGSCSTSGLRSTDPSTASRRSAMPMLFTWSTPWELGKTQSRSRPRRSSASSSTRPDLSTLRLYNPYASVWFSWFLGNGFNLSIGEGAQIGLSNELHDRRSAATSRRSSRTSRSAT